MLGHPLRQRATAQHGGTDPVDPLHLAEIPGRLRLAGQHLPHELRFVVDTEGPVEAALVAHRRLRHRAHALAAGASGAMARPDLQVVGQPLEPGQALEQLLRSRDRGVGDVGGLFEKIGPPHVVHEDEITGDDAHRLMGAGGVGDEKADVLRRVPRGMDRSDLDVADLEGIAVEQPEDPGLLAKLVLPFGRTAGGEVDRGAGARGQLPEAGDKVGVDVGLGHRGDPEALRLGGGDVLVHPAVRIDDQGGPAGAAADEVARLGELIVVEALEEHRRLRESASEEEDEGTHHQQETREPLPKPLR